MEMYGLDQGAIHAHVSSKAYNGITSWYRRLHLRQLKTSLATVPFPTKGTPRVVLIIIIAIVILILILILIIIV
jgi:hypothetical protein